MAIAVWVTFKYYYYFKETIIPVISCLCYSVLFLCDLCSSSYFFCVCFEYLSWRMSPTSSMASKAWLKKYYKKEKINTTRENTDKWHRGFFLHPCKPKQLTNPIWIEEYLDYKRCILFGRVSLRESTPKKKIDLSAPHGTLRVPLDAPKSTALSKASTNKFNFKTGYSRASSLGNRLLSTPMSRGAHFFSTFCVRTKSRLLMTIFLIPRRFIPIYFFWVL